MRKISLSRRTLDVLQELEIHSHHTNDIIGATIDNRTEKFEGCHHLGQILRALRINIGIGYKQTAAAIDLPEKKLKRIEEGSEPVPKDEAQLNSWLRFLRTGPINSRRFRKLAKEQHDPLSVKPRIDDPTTPDIRRILDAYREGDISPYDAELLKLIAR